MSFHEAFVWTILRSVVAAGLAVPLSVYLSRLVQHSTGRSRFWWMLLVLCPLVAPDLIIGYGYRSFELSLLHRPVLNHWFYFVLVLLKFLPAAAVVRILPRLWTQQRNRSMGTACWRATHVGVLWIEPA